MDQFQQAARELGYQRVIHALMHESNRSMKISALWAAVSTVHVVQQGNRRMNVAHLLTAQARQRPDAKAIIGGNGAEGCTISFAELDERSAHWARFLAADGLGAGDPVLVFVPMSIDLYLALIAIFRIGAVAVFLDPSAGADHINRCCEAIEPRALIAITRAHLLRLTSSALRRIPRKFTVGWPLPGLASLQRARRCSPLDSIVPRNEDDPALITFTSGSTGLPKGAVRSHGFLAAQHASLQRAIELRPVKSICPRCRSSRWQISHRA